MFFIAVDQLVKFFITNPFRNYFFAFSLPLPVWLMYGIYLTALAFIFFYLKRNYLKFSASELLPWCLILAGAVSNIAERILHGYVKDFIYITFYRWTGIYNLADAYIILGVILLLASQLFKKNQQLK